MMINEYKINNIFYGIWKIEESTDQLYTILSKQKEYQDVYLKDIKNKDKLKEKLAVRVLLYSMLGFETTLIYTETGKPVLNDVDLNISISHTKGYAAVALSSDKIVGIDIEYISDRVIKIKDKFINNQEYVDIEQNSIHLLIHWSAKESIYKAVNKKGIDFKNNLTIEHFKPQLKGDILGYFLAPKKEEFTINYHVSPEYVVTLAYAKN